MINDFRKLEVYGISYKLAMDIYKITRSFPKEEIYSLTSQIIRSSRSIPANISEGWTKRRYENVFKRHLLDSLGSTHETKTWLDFSKDCGYLSNEEYFRLTTICNELGAKLYNLHGNWKTF